MSGMLTPVMLPVRAAQIGCANKCRIRPEKSGDVWAVRRMLQDYEERNDCAMEFAVDLGESKREERLVMRLGGIGV